MIGLVPQRELRAAYAVGVAAGDRAVMAGQRLVFLQGSETEHDIVGPTRAVGYVDLGDDTAEAEEAHAQAAVVGHREDVDRLSILRGAVRRVIERRGPAEVSSRDHRRQCRGDSKGVCRVRTAFALHAEAACEVYHGISFLRARANLPAATTPCTASRLRRKPKPMSTLGEGKEAIPRRHGGAGTVREIARGCNLSHGPIS